MNVPQTDYSYIQYAHTLMIPLITLIISQENTTYL